MAWRRLESFRELPASNSRILALNSSCGSECQRYSSVRERFFSGRNGGSSVTTTASLQSGAESAAISQREAPRENSRPKMQLNRFGTNKKKRRSRDRK